MLLTLFSPGDLIDRVSPPHSPAEGLTWKVLKKIANAIVLLAPFMRIWTFLKVLAILRVALLIVPVYVLFKFFQLP